MIPLCVHQGVKTNQPSFLSSGGIPTQNMFKHIVEQDTMTKGKLGSSTKRLLYFLISKNCNIARMNTFPIQKLVSTNNLRIICNENNDKKAHFGH